MEKRLLKGWRENMGIEINETMDEAMERCMKERQEDQKQCGSTKKIITPGTVKNPPEWIQTDLLPSLQNPDTCLLNKLVKTAVQGGLSRGTSVETDSCACSNKDISGEVTLIPELLWISYSVKEAIADICLVLCGISVECQQINLTNPTIDLVVNVYFVKAEIKLYLYKPTNCVQYTATACYRSFPSFKWACIKQEGVAFCF